MKHYFFLRLLLLCFVAFFVMTGGVFAQDKDWRPIAPEELALKKPVVEPDADAEAIFWDVHVDDSEASELSQRHYVRVKIFTERGREQYSKHDILFEKGTKVKDVEARVTKPDGSVIFLKKEDVIDRDIVKANGHKIRAKSFALPGLEIGSIVEYRYRVVTDNGSANMRLVFQRDIPIQTTSYYVKPFAGDLSMLYQRFNTPNVNFVKDKNGFHRATMTNVPTLKEEPSMPPEDDVRSWMYIYYSNEANVKQDEYWKDISKKIYESSKNYLKLSDEVKAATAKVINGAVTDQEKLRKIYDFTKTEIRNLTYESNVSDEDRKKSRDIKSGSDALKMKMGSADDIDNLFGAMARAAGFEARVALSGSRDELFFDPNIPNLSLMLNSSSIAVKMGDGWRFFSPASHFVPFGMLSWAEEGQKALVTDSKDLIWVDIPLSSAGQSMEKRTGTFKLLEDGTLIGEARIEFTGHRSALQKNLNRGDSAGEQEKALKNLIREGILGTAEVDKFTIENVSDPDKPFIYTFNIRVPGYASRTGKRLFFQPNVFERSSKPRFTSNTRQYAVFINYPYSEQDEITIEFPKGFSLENGDTPGNIADRQGIGSHETTIGIVKDRGYLTYKRKFSFGNGGFIRFPVDSYPVLKLMFENFNKADTHQLTLRQDTVVTLVNK